MRRMRRNRIPVVLGLGALGSGGSWAEWMVGASWREAPHVGQWVIWVGWSVWQELQYR